jgi:tripartite-type tricarboxylate transporter receptor subunit TctC
MRPVRVLIGASACVVVVFAGCSASASAKKDVTITACTPSPTGGHPSASGRIVNHSSKSSVYTIHVKFSDSAGNGVGDGLAAIAKVDSGTTAKWQASGSFNAKGPLKCKLTSVTRNAVP